MASHTPSHTPGHTPSHTPLHHSTPLRKDATRGRCRPHHCGNRPCPRLTKPPRPRPAPAALSQVVDDMLDFTGSAESLGKPALSDMQQGLATAPTLFAADQFPQIREMITRRFAEEGDVATAPPPPPPPSRPHSYLHPSLTPLPSLTLPPSPSLIHSRPTRGAAGSRARSTPACTMAAAAPASKGRVRTGASRNARPRVACCEHNLHRPRPACTAGPAVPQASRIATGCRVGL